MSYRGRAAVLVLMIGCGSSDSDEVDRRRCEQLRDHLVELRLKSVADPRVNLDAHRKALKQALGDSFVSSCEARTTSAELKCQLAAGDTQAAAACSSPR